MHYDSILAGEIQPSPRLSDRNDMFVQKRIDNDDRPNIIFIITDQQRYDTIAALGYPHVDTPNLDRLVREGVSFEQCHVTAASCAAARASLFKGYYPHTTGILKNADRWRRSWIELLNDSGYYCTNIGKMHTWPFQTELGFHERFVVENKDRYLEGRYFFDEWDKALRFRGLVKQQRELYRKRDDYRSALGAFDWELPEDTHPDMFRRRHGDVVDRFEAEEATRCSCRSGFPGRIRPTIRCRDTPSRIWRKTCRCCRSPQEELDGQPPALKELRQHNQEIDHDSVVMDLESDDAAAPSTTRLLLGQRHDDRRKSRRDHRGARAKRLSRQFDRDLHQRSWRLSDRSRSQSEVDDVRADHAGADDHLGARSIWRTANRSMRWSSRWISGPRFWIGRGSRRPAGLGSPVAVGGTEPESHHERRFADVRSCTANRSRTRC